MALTKVQDGGLNLTSAGLPTLTSSNMPSGTVLQTKFLSFEDLLTNTSTSYADISGFSLSITPSSTSSKILVTFDIGCVYASTSGNGNVCTIYRDDTTDLQGGADLGHFSRVDAANLFVPIYLQQLDSPNTTSAVKYTLYTRSRGGSSVQSPYNSSYSVAVAMEVLA